MCLGKKVWCNSGNSFPQSQCPYCLAAYPYSIFYFKDFEVHDKYQMMAFVVFRDTAALQRIPESGEEFTILAPEIPRKPIHEISLNDLEQYARTDEYQQGFEFDKPESKTTKRVIGGNIRRSSACSRHYID